LRRGFAKGRGQSLSANETYLRKGRIKEDKTLAKWKKRERNSMLIQILDHGGVGEEAKNGRG